MLRSSRWTERREFGAARLVGDERGSASLEFLTVGLLLLVPIVYLVLSVSAIQAGAFAVEGAARHAARLAADGAGSPGAAADVERAVRITLEDFGIDPGSASVSLSCETADCNAPGERIDVVVSARVGLPLVPDVLDLGSIGSVPVESAATQTISRFAGAAE
ncbi:hypothetical protein [Agromyces sp. Leaf222]|uniref:hypothetical protein n=1 Tax=Agromyces sp. Leaf222 TaxID=1735688 RepID=UPI0006F8DF97|nr:hypothetical protein [Agromyces sp. Leaf222]KQM83134.1 hypothetical protein ASE68_07720 [Agromyces sp. Leaf222]